MIKAALFSAALLLSSIGSVLGAQPDLIAKYEDGSFVRLKQEAKCTDKATLAAVKIAKKNGIPIDERMMFAGTALIDVSKPKIIKGCWTLLPDMSNVLFMDGKGHAVIPVPLFEAVDEKSNM